MGQHQFKACIREGQPPLGKTTIRMGTAAVMDAWMGPHDLDPQRLQSLSGNEHVRPIGFCSDCQGWKQAQSAQPLPASGAEV